MKRNPNIKFQNSRYYECECGEQFIGTKEVEGHHHDFHHHKIWFIYRGDREEAFVC